MYNEELKNKFINETYKSDLMQKRAVGVFKISGKIEISEGADICTFDRTKYQRVINMLDGYRGESRGTVSILKKYQEWCINNKIPNAVLDISSMKSDNSVKTDKLKLRTVASPGHLQRYLDFYFKPEAEKYIDNIYRMYYWMAYGGIPFDEILNVRSSDVKLNSMMIIYKEYECPIYKEALPTIKSCIEEKEFMHEGTGASREGYPKERAEGDILLRGFKLYTSPQNIRTTISRRIKKCKSEKINDRLDIDVSKLSITYERAKTSGLFYRMFTAELAKMPPDYALSARWLYNTSSKRNNRKQKMADEEYKYLNALENDLKKDYAIWKKINGI